MNTGAMIALVPSSDSARSIHVPGGEPGDDLHATVAFLGEASELSDTQKSRIHRTALGVSMRHRPFLADAFAVSVYNPNGDDPCIVLGLGGRQLRDIRDEVVGDVGDIYPQREPWSAHMTVEYTDDFSKVASYTNRTGPVVFDTVRVAIGGQVHDYPLVGEALMDSVTAAVNQTSWKSMPVAPRETKFNADDAVTRILNWSEGSASKFNSAFLWRSDKNAVSRNNYRLPIADVVDGKLTLIPRAVFSAAVIMSGGHGGLEGLIKDENERRQIKQVLTEIYDMLREDYDDPRVVAPWLLGRTEEEQQEIRKELEAA